MATETITIQVDADAARAFAAASSEDRRRLELLLSLRLRELTEGRPKSFREIMDEIGAKTEARGLPPEILESLLKDE